MTGRRSNQHVEQFHWHLWLLFAIENWILDFGRPIAMLIFPLEWFPLNLPSVGDYFHMIYNIVTPFILQSLILKSPRKFNQSLFTILMTVFVMGASIHLVGDSINHRLVLNGYQLHLSVRENPIMQKLDPPSLIDSFELLYFYDEELGHYMWYLPYFLCFLLFFNSTFVPVQSKTIDAKGFWSLALLNSTYYWYLVTEGQITPLFIVATFLMTIMWLYQRFINGNRLDVNGRFLLYTFHMTIIFVAVWTSFFWHDEVLRTKYASSLIYVPEPWSVYSLYGKRFF
ncbi:unnamed protein product [Rotaria sp. Silwood2]|nr:unnamed protein product [Rotaria sp. Silwood2]CAF2654927.1 unnamed protein product [Rotaria sp. Silwood2]CAF3027751.1 unnamed protein product [Rotaria sp. Silwood2]CAF4066044.1 unnamed protein product [Rotaria sp. Silwood2]CAF4183272.1 unnamed protein product [Rotaria sp. Silwood2]